MQVQSKQASDRLRSDNRKYRIISICLLLFILLSALPTLKKMLSASPYTPPLYWGSILIATGFFLPRIHVPGRLSQKEVVKGYAITGAVIRLAILFIVGVLSKSLKGTPYDNSLYGVFYNALLIVPALFAREIIRAYGIGTAYRTLRHRSLAIAVITIIMILPEISLNKISAIKSAEGLLIFIVRDFLPTVSENILMSVLVYYGGAGAGVTYRGIQYAFTRTFPFLPELSWLLEGSISIVYPLLYSFFVHERSKEIQEERRSKDEKNAGFVAALVLSVTFAWFCVGVFTLYPAVVLTGSMEPVIYPGDVIIVRKMLEEEQIDALTKGDVITFQRLDYTVTHRIQEVLIDEAGNRSFVTKGDNNESEDQEAVLPNDIRGIVVRVVPKVGMPILIMRSQSEVPEGVIDHEEQIRE